MNDPRLRQDEPVEPDSLPQEGESVEGRTLYTLFNVAEDANPEEIHRGYRRVAGLLHPDRQRDDELRHDAEQYFARLQNAYEILSDPDRREEYDRHGDPVDTSALTTQHRRADASTVRKGGKEDEDRARTRDSVTVGVDARALLIPWSLPPRLVPGTDELAPATFYERLRRTSLVGTSQLGVRHEASFPLEWLSADFKGVAAVSLQRKGTSGELSMAVSKRIMPLTRVECSTSLMGRELPKVKIIRDSRQGNFASVDVSAGVGSTSTTLAVGGPLSRQVNAFCSVSKRDLLAWSVPGVEVNMGLSRRPRQVAGWTWTLRLGQKQQTLTFERAWTGALLRKMTVRAGSSLRLQHVPDGVGLGAGSLFVASATPGFSARIAVDVAGRLLVTARWTVRGQNIIVPVLLADSAEVSVLAGWLMGLPAAMLAMEHLALHPFRRRRQASKLAQVQAERASALERLSKEAATVRQLMQDEVERKRESEAAQGGLVIDVAIYGPRSLLRRSQDSLPEGTGIDVRIPCQALVHDHQLILPAGQSKARLPGFCSLGSPAALWVEYTFGGRQRHRACVDDSDAFAAPLHHHAF